jgi:2-succinyl-6-hydroxy-2,4-cyclohexadiene-1-carboxylate synthase
LAAAVPDVHVTATGRPLALARPSAKKPAQRSSRCEWQRSRPSRTRASTSGLEREPGEVQASVTPQRASSSANARSSRWVSVPAGMMDGVPEPLLLLHGFTQTGRGWDEVTGRLAGERYRPLAPDIRGHGAAGSRRPIEFAACVDDVAGLATGPFALAGYSMGGRLALHVALAHPARVTRLVLVSTTAGIEDDAERARRRADDEALAAWMEGRTMVEVADRWEAQPLFAGQPAAVAAAARADRLANEPADLAAALRGIGTGAMAPLWARLGELRVPATVLAGARDTKFVALAERLAAALPAATLTVVPGAGHALALEAPAAVAAAIEGD